MVETKEFWHLGLPVSACIPAQNHYAYLNMLQSKTSNHSGGMNINTKILFEKWNEYVTNVLYTKNDLPTKEMHFKDHTVTFSCPNTLSCKTSLNLSSTLSKVKRRPHVESFHYLVRYWTMRHVMNFVRSRIKDVRKKLRMEEHIRGIWTKDDNSKNINFDIECVGTHLSGRYNEDTLTYDITFSVSSDEDKDLNEAFQNFSLEHDDLAEITQGVKRTKVTCKICKLPIYFL